MNGLKILMAQKAMYIIRFGAVGMAARIAMPDNLLNALAKQKIKKHLNQHGYSLILISPSLKNRVEYLSIV